MRLSLIPAAAVALALAAGAVAQPAGDRAERHERHMDRMTERLELTDAQRQQVEELMKAHHARTQAARDEIKRSHEQMRNDMRAVLTPEQAAKLDAMHERMGERMHRGHDMGKDKAKDKKPAAHRH